MKGFALDALIFDFDGVIVDSELIHLDCFARVLRPLGVTLAREDYFAKYLGFDDRDCFVAVLRDIGRQASEEEVARMVEAKTLLVQESYARDVKALPGVMELLRAAAAAGVPLAICTGGLPDEIELARRTIGAEGLFAAVVTARDVRHGKPHPEGYRLALKRLRAATGRKIRAAVCVVVEDSPAGIDAARAAGLKVLAVTNSYPPEALARAHRVVTSLAEVTLGDLEKIAAA